MNRYLIKIAELSTSKLPYRDRVEILIYKGSTFLITKNKNKDTGEEWNGFPGGGVDDQTEEQACLNECLEEVGIKISNLQPTKVTLKEEGGMSKKENRHLKFRGSRTRWYIAEYESMDRSKLGEDGDSRQYTWQGLSEALRAVKNGTSMGKARADVLNASKAL